MRLLPQPMKLFTPTKRAQELPITTIIVAGLGVVILVVVAAIFSGKIGAFGRISSSCPGTCVMKSKPADLPSEVQVRVDEACQAEFETKLTGVYIPKDLPKDKTGPSYLCTACCINS